MKNDYSNKSPYELMEEIARLKSDIDSLRSERPRQAVAYTNDPQLASYLGYMFEIALDGIFVIDTNGRYRAVNPAGCMMFGYTAEEFFSSDIRLLLFPEDVGPSFKTLSLHELREGRFNPEFRMRHKDGRELWIDFTVRRFSLGEREYVLGIKRDATDRRRAEEALARSQTGLEKKVEERTNALSEANKALLVQVEIIKSAEAELRRKEAMLKDAQAMARIGSWEWDVKKGSVAWSDETFRIFGYRPNEVAPSYNAFLSIVHPEDKDSLVDAISGCLYFNKPYDIDLRAILPEGQERVINIRAGMVFDEEKRPLRMTGVVQDITEKKKIEEKLITAQKLESIGTLAGGIGHDFSNILLGVLGYITIAKKQVGPEEKLYGILNEIEKSALRARSLTRQLLTFSSGGGPVKESVQIRQLLEDAVNFILKKSDIKTEFAFPGGLWPVSIDEGQISQVFNNIILNAREAMPDRGRLEICAENAAIPPDSGLPLKPGNYVRVIVRDTGPGIPEAMLPKVFDPFFTTKKKASGLGLALSYSIVKRHLGYICAESGQEGGAVFTVYLPCPAQEAERSQEEATMRPKKKKARVLVMDDEDIVRDVAGEMLDAMGVQAEFASRGEEAVELYKASLNGRARFDGVVLDLTVSTGMGGKETIKRLLEIDPKVKAIVSSGYSKDPVMSDYRAHGFKGVVSKPYTVTEFTKAIKALIEEKR